MARPMRSGTGARLYLGELPTLRIRASRSPQFSTIQWALTAAGKDGPERARATGVHERRETRAAWAALGVPGLDRVPDFVMPAPPLDSGVTQQARRLREISGSVLSERIYALWGPTPPGPWQRAADRPRAWLSSFAEATLDVWSACAPRWQRGQRIIDKEINRIGAAVVTDTADVLLNTLHPRLRYEAGVLRFDSYCDRAVALGDRELVLVPMLSGTERLAVSFDHPGYAYIAYPVQARDDWQSSARAPRSDRLAALLSPIRASALRALDRPKTMGALATLLYCTPSTATYHCNYLADAGLLVRERRAQTVWVSRTERADELIDLLSDSERAAAG